MDDLTNICNKTLWLAIFHGLVSLLLPSTTTELPKTLDERLSPRLPSAQRLWLHVLYRQHRHLPILASRARSIRGSPPAVTRANGTIQRLRLRRPRLDILRSGVLAILAQTVGVGRSPRCQEACWTHHTRHSLRKSPRCRSNNPHCARQRKPR
jgi:hypothetical protein